MGSAKEVWDGALETETVFAAVFFEVWKKAFFDLAAARVRGN